MAVALVPAAGRSRRMGRPKPLLPYRGTTVVGALVDTLRRAGIERIVVVRAPADRDLERWGAEAGVEVAVNPAPERGMLSSIWSGLEAAGGAAELARRGETLVLCPCDHPAIRARTVRRLLAAGPSLAVPLHGGRRGHPLVVPPALVEEIPRLDPDVGLRQLLDRFPARLVEVEVDDPGVLADVDTPEDYRALDPEGPA